MADLDTVQRSDGVVLPAPEVVARYRAAGVWDDTLLPDLVLRHAAERPDAVALSDAVHRLTWARLAAAVDGVAVRLAADGFGRHDRVLLRLPNCVELVVTLLALMRIGARPILAVPALRDREIGHVVRQAGPVALAVHAPVRSGYSLDLAGRMRDEHPAVRRLLVLGSAPDDAIDLGAHVRDALAGDGPGGPHAKPEPCGDGPDDVAMYLLSSGTTGLPKPIPRTHQDYGYMLRANIEAGRAGPDTVFLAALSMAHTFTLGCPGVLGTLAAGGQVVLSHPDPEHVAGLLAAERITMTALVPSVALKVAGAVAAGGHDASALRVLQIGGARLAAPHARQLADALGCRLQQAYGMSEGLQNYTRLDDPPDVVTGTQGRPVSPWDEWRVVDEQDRDVAPGESGELLTRGPHLTGGYLAAPEINRRAFTPDGYFRTGDVVRWHPSGNFVVEGRREDFVNVGGEKVSAQELEELLLEHPAVAQCAVVAMPDPGVGEAPCAFVVPAAGVGLTLREARAHLDRAGIARYKFPVCLKLVDTLPSTSLGKLDRAALRRDLV